MRKKLLKNAFVPYSLRELSPEGWYLDQLQIQADGLSGNLHEFWPDIKDSSWIGGSAEGWERMPYFLDGFIPLSFLLGDEKRKTAAKRFIDAILDRQAEDGWICPAESLEARYRYDVWAVFLICKTLVVWHDATGDERIEDAIYRALLALDRVIDRSVLFEWAQLRWFEGLISIFWLYERRPEEWIYDLAIKLRAQGFDWISFYRDLPECMKEKTTRGRWSQMNHVVNNAMMLKSSALMHRLTGNTDANEAARDTVSKLDKYHGMVTGVFTGDECLAGLSPVQGTELCSVAEYMYSLQHLLGLSADPFWGDRLELIAFNALPATFSPDMWTHQYDQQVNQMECSIQETATFLTNGGDAHTFGLEPNYGCCTANLSQAWPKLIQSAVMKAEDGPAVAAWIPLRLESEVNGKPFVLSIKTDYPFRSSAKVTISSADANRFTLRLRIPAWAEGATVSLNGESLACTPGTYLELNREWSGDGTVELGFPMKPICIKRENGLYALKRGSLVYSLAIGEAWRRYNEDKPGREFPHCDYEVLPTTAWNYSLCVDPENPAASLAFEERPVSHMPFCPENAPVVCRARGRKVKWETTLGSAAETPSGAAEGPAEDIILIPYGATTLRMTELPVAGEK